MKNIIFKSLVFAALSFFAASLHLQAQNVDINATNFPDENFRKWVLAQTYGKDSVLTPSEISTVTKINVYGKNISSLDGIGYFTKLDSLYCDKNQLSALDVSKNTELRILHCQGNQLTSLDVSQNTKLKFLNCSQNQIGSLNVTLNNSLQELFCSDNQLQRLQIGVNDKLYALSCSNNQLGSLNLLRVPALRYLSCYKNELSGIIMPNSTDLERLDCGYNQMASLDYLTPFTKLRELNCEYNQIASLDVTQNTKLDKLYCRGNQLTGLDVTQNSNLTVLNCEGNDLTELDLTKNTILRSLYCGSNQFTELDLTQNTKLVNVDCWATDSLSRLVLPNSTTLKELKCSYCTLAELDVTQNPNLTTLKCYGNQLTGLDVTQNPNLMTLQCEQNQLTGLDVTQNSNLTTLQCFLNQLTELDVTQNPNLTTLQCHFNQLTELDLTQNPNLTTLTCQSNRLQDLDLSQNAKLRSVGAGYQYLYNPNLYAVGNGRDKVGLRVPKTLEASRMTGLTVHGESIPAEFDYDQDGNQYLALATYNGADINRTSISSAQIFYQVKPLYAPGLPASVTNVSLNVNEHIPPYHVMYINPASAIPNLTGGSSTQYVGTICLDVPTYFPGSSDSTVHIYSSPSVSAAEELAGKLSLKDERNSSVLPAGTGALVVADVPGLHVFTGYIEFEYRTSYDFPERVMRYKTSPEPWSSNILTGTTTGVTVPYGSVLTLGPRRDDGSGTVGFWNYAGTQIPPYRCYIPNDKIPSAMLTPKFKGLYIFFDEGDNTVTGLDTAPAGNPASAVYYDLQGRRVPAPKKGGIYIVGGRKVVY